MHSTVLLCLLLHSAKEPYTNVLLPTPVSCPRSVILPHFLCYSVPALCGSGSFLVHDCGLVSAPGIVRFVRVSLSIILIVFICEFLVAGVMDNNEIV